MRILLRWLGLILALIAARILIAVVILGAVLFLVCVGLQAAHLPVPTLAQIEQRMAPALREIAPALRRLRDVASAPVAAPSEPASGPQSSAFAP